MDLETGGFKPELILIENKNAELPSLKVIGTRGQVIPEPSEHSSLGFQISPVRSRAGSVSSLFQNLPGLGAGSFSSKQHSPDNDSKQRMSILSLGYSKPKSRLPKKRVTCPLQRLGDPEDSYNGQTSVQRPNNPEILNKSGNPDFVPFGKDSFNSFKATVPEYNDADGLGDSKGLFSTPITSRSETIEIMETLTLQKSSSFGEISTNKILPTGMNGEILDYKDRGKVLRSMSTIKEGLDSAEDVSPKSVIGLESEKTPKSLHDNILKARESKSQKYSMDLADKPPKSPEFDNSPVEINKFEQVRISKKSRKEGQILTGEGQLEELVEVFEAKEVASGIHDEGSTTPVEPLLLK